ncbi:MAG: cytochrome c biogenesis protein ResB [Propionibacteriaceae bacterium]|jgi:cytochrome c biogenesis protein|nr:cytochrome c biogenesis protein ResB [Propionibacteriaceae bacterium]
MSPADHGRNDQPEPAVSPGEFFRRVYQFFYSKTVGLILILTLAALVLLGALITQATAGTYDDAMSKAIFVQDMRSRYGALTGALDWLGLFHIFSSIPFLVVAGLLAASILACTIHRLPQLWRRHAHPPIRPGDRFFARARYRATIATSRPTAQATALASRRLRQGGLRLVADGDDPGRLYADRFSWGGLGTVVAHLSLLIILAAFVTSSLGKIDANLTLGVDGPSVAVGHDSGLELAASEFVSQSDAAGRPLDYMSHLVLSRDGQVVAEQDVRVNSPLSYGGYKFHQWSYSQGIDVLITGPGGVLTDATLAIEGTTEDGAAGASYELPGSQTVWFFVPVSGQTGADSGIEPGQALIEVAAGDQLVAQQTVASGQAFVLGDYAFTFEGENWITVIAARRDPGALWMWLGSILLVAGMSLTFACRHRRYWARLSPGTDGRTRLELASSDPEDVSFRRLFDQLATDLAEALDGVVLDQTAETGADTGAETEPRAETGTAPETGTEPETKAGISDTPDTDDASDTAPPDTARAAARQTRETAHA